MRKYLAVGIIGILLFVLLVQQVLAVTLVLNDGSSYEVELIETDGQTFVYRVTELTGKDLSHWSIGLCLDHFVSAEPEGYEVGPDGSTSGFVGVKWETDPSFTSGTFTITVDMVYPIVPIEVLVKAGSNHTVGFVDGPSCVLPPSQDDPPTSTPTSTATPTETATSTSTPTHTMTPTDTPTEEPTATHKKGARVLPDSIGDGELRHPPASPLV